VKLLKDAMEMEGTGPSEELQEVENELIAKRKDDEPDDPERGHSQTEPQTSNLLRVVNVETQVFTQAFTLTFLAEWGDRSQIATIAIASTKSVLGVIVGGLIGHALCTGLAVLGGRMLAAKISERTVAFSGGTLFLVFAVHSFIVGP
jgi:putative Ca2+/H+ antiporter (TMEM165/GDT1 family)